MKVALGRVVLSHAHHHIISVPNLLEAWREFLRGKRSRKDAQEFERNLMTNILALHKELTSKTYAHSPYQAFNISDPKPRNIHKATVRDRLLHHALHRRIYPFFDRTFIHSLYSCRAEKGMHKAINRFRDLALTVSQNHTRTAWVLKCDIRWFFASIEHGRLIGVLQQYIPDNDIVWLLSRIIGSFEMSPGVGLPLGNLTSQLFVNVYMNEFDQFVKHQLKAKYYVRYADDFLFLSRDRLWLESILPRIQDFLWNKLRLALHPQKISIRTVASGVDFLGWVHFPDHCVLRTTTKRRMFRGIEKNPTDATLASYLGMLRHGNTEKLRRQV